MLFLIMSMRNKTKREQLEHGLLYSHYFHLAGINFKLIGLKWLLYELLHSLMCTKLIFICNVEPKRPLSESTIKGVINDWIMNLLTIYKEIGQPGKLERFL